jgi:hypothetical protein
MERDGWLIKATGCVENGIASPCVLMATRGTSSGRSCETYARKKELQLGVGLIRPLRSRGEKFVHIECLPVFEHKINSPTKFVSLDGQGLALAVLVGQFAVQLPAGFIAFEKKLRSLGKCPAQVRVAYLFTGVAIFFAIGFLGAFD